MKYTVQCKDCQQDMTVELFGPMKSRDWKLANYEWVCKTCQNIAQSAAEKATATAQNFPELEGSEKQISWASSIRQKAFEVVQDRSFPNDVKHAFMKVWDPTVVITPMSEVDYLKYLNNAIKHIFSEDKAKWWIDNRDNLARTLTTKAAEHIKDYLLKNKTEEETNK